MGNNLTQIPSIIYFSGFRLDATNPTDNHHHVPYVTPASANGDIHVNLSFLGELLSGGYRIRTDDPLRARQML